MGMLSDGADWLAEQLLEHCSESVTYTRGAYATTVNAVIGGRRRREDQKPDSKVVMVGEPMDFQFDPADLVLNSATITPARGDVITWSSRTYHVKPRDGDDVYVPSDDWGNLITVHTVRAS